MTAHDDDIQQSHDNEIVIYILFVIHILSYIAGEFRKWEQKKKGKPDVNGVLRAPVEFVL